MSYLNLKHFFFFFLNYREDNVSLKLFWFSALSIHIFLYDCIKCIIYNFFLPIMHEFAKIKVRGKWKFNKKKVMSYVKSMAFFQSWKIIRDLSSFKNISIYPLLEFVRQFCGMPETIVVCKITHLHISNNCL